MIDVISIGPVVVWAGDPKRSQRRVRDIAKWRDRYPTLGHVMQRLDLPPDPLLHAAAHEWSIVVLTRMDDGKPRNRVRYHVGPTGTIYTVQEDVV